MSTIDVAEPIRVAARLRARRPPPQQRLEPRHQLDRLERLGQVIVGAELEADHLVDHLPSRRQHQDGRRHPALPHLAADVEAVHPRQHDVEHDEVVAAARRAREARLAVARRLDGVAFAAEPIAERQPQAGFVFDEQDARGRAHRPQTSAALKAAPDDARGSSTTMVVPSPARLSTRNRALVRIDRRGARRSGRRRSRGPARRPPAARDRTA